MSKYALFICLCNKPENYYLEKILKRNVYVSKIVKKDVLSYCDHYVGFFPILYFAYLNEEKKKCCVYTL